MQIASIYARNSSEEQRATSIDDQIRRTREIAESHGYKVDEELIFFDAAITGTAKGISKRAGYAQLCAAWERREFDALYVDEVSRLARDVLELAKLQERIERSGVRVVSTDGLLDTARPGWQLAFGMSSVIAAHAVRETRHRVIRGMEGQLERGFMIAAPPFGYRAIRPSDAGTTWVIEESQAQWIRQIFELRHHGRSFAAIAEHLNRHQVPTPRAPRKEKVRYWRPATVRQLVANPIYRGSFILNGSPFTKAKAKREGKKIEPRTFERPALRLVDDAMWSICNPPASSRKLRGGGKHWAAGLVSCGICGATLTVAVGGSVPSLYCAQCAQARRVGLSDRQGAYVSAHGLQAILEHALVMALSGEALTEFRKRLRDRLAGGEEKRIGELKLRIEQLKRAGERLLRLLKTLDDESEQVEQQYRDVSDERKVFETELETLETGLARLDRSALEQQLSVDPRQLLPKLFDGSAPPERVRAALAQVFSRVEFLGKQHRFVSDFKVTFSPGAALAFLTSTGIQEHAETTVRLRVSSGARRPAHWQVTVLEEHPI